MSFSDQIVFMSSMNEKKPNLDWTFEEVRGDLDKFSVGAVSIIGPNEADHWWPDSAGSADNKKWTDLSYHYFGKLISGRHLYLRGSAPMSQLDIRSWISNARRQCYDHHFQDSTTNVAKMVQLITNLPILNRMLGALYEVASQVGLLPNVPPFTPRWISKFPGLGQDEQEEATPGSLNAAPSTAPDEDERERQICNKLAMLASLPVPCLGDRYVASDGLLLFDSDKFTNVVSSIEAGKTTGPITYHGSYEETCASDFWNTDAGIYVEYTDEVIH